MKSYLHAFLFWTMTALLTVSHASAQQSAELKRINEINLSMLQEWDSKNFDHVIDLLTLAADYDMTAVGNDVNDVLFGIKEAIAGSPSYALMIRAKDLTGHYKVIGNAWVKEGDADDMRLEFSDRNGAPCVFSMVKGGQMRNAKLPLDGTRTGFGKLLSDEFVPMLGETIQKVMAYLDDVEYIQADIPDYIDIAVTQGERTLATVNITHDTTTEGENLKGLLISNHAKISRSDGTGDNELILRNSGYQPGNVGINLDFEVKTPSKTLLSIKFSMPGTINNDLKNLSTSNITELTNLDTGFKEIDVNVDVLGQAQIRGGITDVNSLMVNIGTIKRLKTSLNIGSVNKLITMRLYFDNSSTESGVVKMRAVKNTATNEMEVQPLITFSSDKSSILIEKLLTEENSPEVFEALHSILDRVTALIDLYDKRLKGETIELAPAPTPATQEAYVQSIYSDSYTPITTFEFGGQDQGTTTVTTEALGGNDALKLTNFDRLRFNYAIPLDLSDMEYLHIDVLPMQPMELHASPVVSGATPAENPVSLGQLNSRTWNSIDIDLSAFGIDLGGFDNIQLLLNNGSGTDVVYLDNIYFWTSKSIESRPEPDEAPTEAASNVLAIYSNTYGAINYQPSAQDENGGYASQRQVKLADGDRAIRVTDAVCFGLNMGSQDITDYESLHISVYSEKDVEGYVQMMGTGMSMLPLSLKAGQWNRLELAMTGERTAATWILLNVGTPSTPNNIYVDNVFFSKQRASIPMNITVADGVATVTGDLTAGNISKVNEADALWIDLTGVTWVETGVSDLLSPLHANALISLPGQVYGSAAIVDPDFTELNMVKNAVIATTDRIVPIVGLQLTDNGTEPFWNGEGGVRHFVSTSDMGYRITRSLPAQTFVSVAPAASVVVPAGVDVYELVQGSPTSLRLLRNLNEKVTLTAKSPYVLYASEPTTFVVESRGDLNLQEGAQLVEQGGVTFLANLKESTANGYYELSADGTRLEAVSVLKPFRAYFTNVTAETQVTIDDGLDHTAPVLGEPSIETGYYDAKINIAATDDRSGMISYTITFGEKTMQQNLESGANVSIAYTQLTPNTNYTVTIVAKDEAGNATEPTVISFTTRDPVAEGIEAIREDKEADFYTMDGRRTTARSKGLKIQKMSNGKIKKVLTR